MAAPSGIAWGSTVGDYGRIGIYTSLSSTNTQTTLTLEIWFWSKYSVSDTSNTLYVDNLSAAGSAQTSRGACSINTTVASGSGWSTSNQKKLKTYTVTYDRKTSAQTRYLYAKLVNIDRVGGTMYASKTVSIPKLASYVVTYDANGGTGAPDAQTKWYGTTLTLSSTVPTRAGYTFQGWGSSAAATSPVNQPGGTYTGNTSYTYYAIWKSNTWTVSYNANGGAGAPGNQTKIQGQTLTLSTVAPTRSGYNFVGWGTSASDTTKDYDPGATYNTDAALNLYAIWELKTYTISYNANGGTGAPGNQTKNHGTTLILSTTKPTRTDYNFKGWATSATSISVSYAAGGNYTNETSVTLYAVWESAYRKPTISLPEINGVVNTGSDASLIGASISFEWSTYYNVTNITVSWRSGDGSIIDSTSLPASGKSGSFDNYIFIEPGTLPTDQSFTIRVTVSDDAGSSFTEVTMEGDVFPIDMLGGGKGVSFGKPAELENVADFAFNIKARKSVEFDDTLTVAKKSTFNGGLDAKVINVTEKSTFNGGLDAKVINAAEKSTFNGGIDAKVINATEKSGFPGGVDTSTMNANSIELFHATPYIDFHFAEDGGDYTSRIIEYERGTLSTDNWRVTGTLTLGGIAHTGNNKILWASSAMMNAEDTVTLSEAISAQPNGVVLVWSCYSSGTVQDWGWTTTFIPKIFIVNKPGAGIDIPLMRQSVSVIGCKYIYVNDTTIKGHANNSLTGSATTGPSYNNGYWVLRYVIGI